MTTGLFCRTGLAAWVSCPVHAPLLALPVGSFMARFEIPTGWTAQAYRFALDPTPTQVRLLESHCGAARFAFNHMLAFVRAVADQRAAERSYAAIAAAEVAQTAVGHDLPSALLRAGDRIRD